ncbi:hypothetical protein ACLOJK_003907 [Asimina triloba]
MELEVLGMNFGCVLRSLSEWRIPEKDCLLPLISKLLGYCIVAASTTVKVPQVGTIIRPNIFKIPARYPISFFCSNTT